MLADTLRLVKKPARVLKLPAGIIILLADILTRPRRSPALRGRNLRIKLKSPWGKPALIGLLAFCLAPVAGKGQSKEFPLAPLKVDVGEKAPDFSVLSPNGETVRLSDFAGHNVLIDFYRGYW